MNTFRFFGLYPFCLAWLASMLLLSSCQNERKKLVENAPVITTTLKDDKGQNIQLPNVAQKVISLAPNITEMIFAIGAQSKLVARSQACDFPAQAQGIEAVTTYPSLDIEKLKSLQPDLILTTDEIFGPDAVALLDNQGMKTYVQSYKTMADIYRNIRDLGKVLECEERAEKVADSLEKFQQKIWKRTQDLAKYGTVMIVSDEPLKVVGGTGYLNEMITKAGGKNMYKDKQEAYPTTTPEELLSFNPEYLIFPSDDKEIFTKLVMKYPGFSFTHAAEHHQVFVVSPDIFYRPGPRSAGALFNLTQILHSSVTDASLAE